MNVKRFLLAAMIPVMLVVMLGAAPKTANAAAVTCGQYHVVVRGETLFRLARLYGTTVSEIQRLNALGTGTRILVGQALCVREQQAVGTPYVVQRGDTLRSIARRFGVDWRVLARINNISTPNRIYVGQVIIIPDVTIQ